MNYSIGDVVDRLSIVMLKKQRQPEVDVTEEESVLNIELERVSSWIGKAEVVHRALEELYRLNGMIWDRESDIRKGKEKILGLEEVGRRAIEIRDINVKRVEQKNNLNAFFKVGFQEVKHTLKPPTYDVCIIGIRGVGMAHAIACERQGFNVKAVLDPDKEQRLRLQQPIWRNEWGPYKEEIEHKSQPLFTSDKNEFFNITGDLLIISCPTRFHAHYVRAYGRNFRSILCEKPFDFSVKLIEAIPEQLRPKVSVGHKWMCHSEFPMLFDPPGYIAQGHEYPPNRPDPKECQVWWDLGIHSVAAMLHYLPRHKWSTIKIDLAEISTQEANVVFSYDQYPFQTEVDVVYESIGDGEVQIGDKLLHWENLFDNQLKRIVTSTHPADYDLGLEAVKLVQKAEEVSYKRAKCVASTEPLAQI